MAETLLSSENFSASTKLEPCHLLQLLGYYTTFLCIAGTLLNGFILSIFIRNQTLRQSSTNLFIAGLVFADFIGALVCMPMPAWALLSCRWPFGYAGCVIEAILVFYAGCSNMYLLCVISIDRYFVVTRSFTASSVSTKSAYVIILGVYILATFWATTPLFGWSQYDYEGVGASCSIKWEERSFNVTSYVVSIFTCVFFIPITIILVTNFIAIKKIRQRRRRSCMNLNAAHSQRQYAIERRITMTITCIIIGFFLAWTPYAITAFMKSFFDAKYLSPIFGTIPALFAKSSIVWNPLIYVVRNGNIRYYLPFCARNRAAEERHTSDVTPHSANPCSSVQFPLTTTHSSTQS